MERTAVFAGSFNPFTIGHRSIVERGLELFDRIIIAIGHNGNKPDDENLVSRIERIRKIFHDDIRVDVMAYSGLTAAFVKRTGACAVLRGIRNISDLEYERNLADVNKNLLGVETVFLVSLPEYSFISSSMVRELEQNGYDVSALLP